MGSTSKITPRNGYSRWRTICPTENLPTRNTPDATTNQPPGLIQPPSSDSTTTVVYKKIIRPAQGRELNRAKGRQPRVYLLIGDATRRALSDGVRICAQTVAIRGRKFVSRFPRD